MAGFFAEVDPSTQAVLRAIARAHPRKPEAEELRKQIPTGGRDLRGIMSTISKRFGKGRAVVTEVERRGKERVFLYGLSKAMLAVAQSEGWAA